MACDCLVDFDACQLEFDTQKETENGHDHLYPFIELQGCRPRLHKDESTDSGIIDIDLGMRSQYQLHLDDPIIMTHGIKTVDMTAYDHRTPTIELNTADEQTEDQDSHCRSETDNTRNQIRTVIIPEDNHRTTKLALSTFDANIDDQDLHCLRPLPEADAIRNQLRTFDIPVDNQKTTTVVLNTVDSHVDRSLPETDDPRNQLRTVGVPVPGLDSHCHRPPPTPDNRARNQLLIVSILCFIFMMVEIIGGLLSNSLALITDATHLASDLSSFFVGLFAIWLSKRPPTPRMSFGFHRADVIGALISILIIWLLTGALVYLAVDRMIDPNYEIDAAEMLLVAILGVVFNIVMGVVLSGACCKCSIEHGHSHFGGGGHCHSHGNVAHAHENVNKERNNMAVVNTNRNANESIEASSHVNHVDSYPHTKKHNVEIADSEIKGHNHQNMNVRAALIHVLGDLIQSIGVLVAAVIIFIEPSYKIADPICTFTFSILVLITTFTVMRDIFYVLMEAAPHKVEYAKMIGSLENIPGVQTAHSLHVWGLTMSKTAISVHLAIEENVMYATVVKKASRMLRDDFGGYHVTVQVEPYQEDVMKSCEQCLGPKVKPI